MTPVVVKKRTDMVSLYIDSRVGYMSSIKLRTIRTYCRDMYCAANYA